MTIDSNFLYYASITLGAKTVIELGCNVGNNLASFTDGIVCIGIDVNRDCIKIATNKHPNIDFIEADLKDLSKIPSNSIDLVFTRGVLIHIHDKDLDKVLSEMVRISKRFIMTLEEYNEEEREIRWRPHLVMKTRNMIKRWAKYPVRLVSTGIMPFRVSHIKDERLTIVEKA